jgi:hypothetical protein
MLPDLTLIVVIPLLRMKINDSMAVVLDDVEQMQADLGAPSMRFHRMGGSWDDICHHPI